MPGAISRMLDEENKILYTDTNITESQDLLAWLKPSLLFSLTPFHEEEYLLLRAASLQKIPAVTSILSFDNPTTRGWIPIMFDKYLVWNRYNKAELLRIYPGLLPDQIEIVGPVQFDLYKAPKFFWSEEEWRQKLKLPNARPVILYASSVDSIISDEDNIVKELDSAVAMGELPNHPVILLRLHPTDTRERWQHLLSRTQNVILDDNFNLREMAAKNKYRNIVKYATYTDEDIKQQVSTFRYSMVHISVSSTISLDGAIFDRPQVNPAFNGVANKRKARCIRELYQREHYLPIVQSGGIEIVKDRTQMVSAVADALVSPEKRSAQRRDMIQDLVTFTDGQCAQRVSNALRKFLDTEVAV
jgi:hypothetical protein